MSVNTPSQVSAHTTAPTAPTAPSSMTSDKIFHAKCYMEPDLYTIVQRVAENDGESLSAWLRKLILAKLIERGQISTELLIKLASG